MGSHKVEQVVSRHIEISANGIDVEHIRHDDDDEHEDGQCVLLDLVVRGDHELVTAVSQHQFFRSSPEIVAHYVVVCCYL